MNIWYRIAAGCLIGGSSVLCGACSEEIVTPGGKHGGVGIPDTVVAYLQSSSGKDECVVELSAPKAETSVRVGLTRKAGCAVDVVMKAAPEYVAQYNERNGTSFEPFPGELLTFEEDGAVLIGPEDVFSEYMDLSVKKGEGTVDGTTYLLPVSFDVKTDGVKAAEDRKVVYLFVKAMAERPEIAKPGDFVMAAYFEVNDMNPLNAMNYTLEKSGAPFFDIVNIFAGNINYDAESGRAYVHFNRDVAHLLSNRDKYIAPLQAKGIRVCLTILGNHDRIGLANLSPEGAREFARELRAVVDAYGLDGVDFDDEWSDYPTRPDEAPGFLVPSSEHYGRLIIETRRVMPDKLVTLYAYGHTSFYGAIDGKRIGEMVDYAWNSSYLYADYTTISSFSGMLPGQWGPYSVCLNPDSDQYTGDTISDEELRKVREGGYGVMIWYDLRTDKRQNYVPRFSQASRILYGEEVCKKGHDYGKDW